MTALIPVKGGLTPVSFSPNLSTPRPSPGLGSELSSVLALNLTVPKRLVSAVPQISRTFEPGAGSKYASMLSRSEEHTSELQSRENLVCRLLLEKKKYT